MRLLVDTHVVLAMFDPESFGQIDRVVVAEASAVGNELHVSVASLWEIAIKVRTGKLDLNVPLSQLPEVIEQLGCNLLPIDGNQVLTDVDPWPGTKDPFDRLLIAICAAEGLRLLTADRILANHLLAWPAPA